VKYRRVDPTNQLRLSDVSVKSEYVDDGTGHSAGILRTGDMSIV
jgi:hypothetical protein